MKSHTGFSAINKSPNFVDTESQSEGQDCNSVEKTIKDEELSNNSKILAKKNFPHVSAKSNPAQALLGTSVYTGMNWLIDYPIYTFLIYKFGALLGGTTVVLIALTFDIMMLRLYTWSQSDWLLLELIKTNRKYTGGSLIKNLMSKLLNAPKFIQILVLSLKTYPPVVVFLMREKAYDYSKMTLKDWGVFFVSSFIGNVYWVMVVAGGIMIARGIL